MNDKLQNIKLEKLRNVTMEDIEKFEERLGNVKNFMAYYECAAMEIETKFNVLNKQFSLSQDYNPIETIKTRIKSIDSIIGKLWRKNLSIGTKNIEQEIFDIAGVRVICPFIEDIYLLSNCLLQQDDIKLIEKKDYIKNPKENGYRSLHLIVEIPIFLKNEKRQMKVEIQLRTIAMDFWASLEHHIRYKKNVDREKAKQVADELKKCAEDSAELDLRMEKVKNIIGKEIEWLF